MSIDPVLSVFAYGTLKSGQCRERCWPSRPIGVAKAWTLGELYDTGPYPALFPGSDRVAGELWTFSVTAIETVLAELDEVEEYATGCEATNLYNREVVQCTDEQGRIRLAYTYIYARSDEKRGLLRVMPRVMSDGQTSAVWPAAAAW